ncbi:MAG: GAF domain-containing protein [Anaerolineae bacterium]
MVETSKSRSELLAELARLREQLAQLPQADPSDREMLLDDMQERTVRMQTAAEISQAASSMLSLDELLPQSVELIRQRFGLYYVGIFLLDDTEKWAELRAGTGEAGRQMLRNGHRLRVGGDSMIGTCVATSEARVALNVDEATPRFDNPLLPETESEMALPLVSRGRVIGAMTIQSKEERAFGTDDITVLQTMAGQLANAIQNARMFERMDRAVQENETLYNVSTAVNDARTIEDLVEVVADVAVFLGMDHVSLHVFTHWDEQGAPLTVDLYGLRRGVGETGVFHESDVPFSRTLFEWFFADPRHISAYRNLADPGVGIPDGTRERLLQDGNRSMIAAPLVARGRRQGVLTMYGKRTLEDLSDHYIQIFTRTLVDQVASVLDRHFLVDELERRAAHLAIASEISRAASSYLDRERLLNESASLIQQRFGLYYVGIYLLDDSSRRAVLQAASGEAGRKVIEGDHRYTVDRSSRIGQCIVEQVPVVARATRGGTLAFDTPHLAEGLSEVALPLISRGKAIGAVRIQKDETSGFSQEDITIFTTMTDQLANAILNAQLYERSQANLDELQRMQQRYALDMWEEHLERQDVLGYSYDLNEITPLMPLGQLLMPDPGDSDAPVARRGVEGGDGAALVQALELRGESIGLLSFEEPASTIDWSEDQIDVLEAVREQLQLALENRLLIDRSQRALREARQREAELGFLQDVSALLNAVNDVAAARDSLMSRLRQFVPVSHLALVGYDAEEDALIFLGGVGDGIQVYETEDLVSGLRGSGFARVIEHGSHYLQDDLRLSPQFSEDERLAALGVLSRLLLPLRLGYRTVGVLELGSAQVGAFSSPSVISILRQVAAQVASAVERGNLLNVAQASADESQRLYEATSALAEATNADAVLEAITRHGLPSGLAGVAEIGLYVVDPETGAKQDWLEIVASVGIGGASAIRSPGIRLRVDGIVSLNLLGDEQIFVSQEIAEDERLGPDVRSHYLDRGVQSLVVAALSTGVGTGDRIGVLQILLQAPYQMTEQDLRLYHTILDQAAVVLSNRQLFQESQARVERQAVAVELANLTTSLSDREILLQESVDFLKERFGLYYAGIFLLDDRGQWAVLQAGTGEIGERLMLMGHRIQVGGRSMVGQCAQRGERILALDVDADTAVLENPLLPDAHSAVAFPLVSRGQITGVISLQSARRFAFTEDDLATLELMVNQLANVIESTNLYERSQSSLAETRMLYRIAQQISDARDAGAVLAAAVDGISQRAEPDWVVAGLLEPQQNPNKLRIVESWSRGDKELPATSYPLDRIRQLYDILRLDERFITPDITQDPMVDAHMRRLYSELGLRATAAFQLKVPGAQYGTIMVHSENAREFSTAELSFYENVARQAFVALENISLVEATREQAERRDILNQVLQTASSSLDDARILRNVGYVIADRLDMPVMMWQWDGVSAELVSAHDAGGWLVAGEREELPFSANQLGHIYEAVQQRRPIDIVFGSNGDGGVESASFGLASKLVEGYAVPLAARDAVYGVLCLGRQIDHEPIDELEREFIRTAGANISVALETANLYREAQETAKKLKEVDQLKNQFMANMSHELRTPLNSIIGFSRVMLKGIDGPLTEMQQTDLNAIHDSGRHLLDLINDILDISKINAGKMEAVFEPIDIKAMVESVLSTALGFVKDKPVKLLSDVPDAMPPVVADGRRIRQVMINLLGNAGKFTEEGFIKISATYDDHQVIISVQDTGIGIPSDRIHAVFEQFEQVDSSSTRRYGGTGLGVPLSREFVRMHGGDMWVQESIVGEGTTFCFSLPIGGPDSVREDGRPKDGDPMAKVVLTVDDDEGVVTLFRRYLEKQGYRVFGLTSSERLVEETKRLRPYAITLDVVMPGQDGWETIRALKSDPETRDIPIIICSIVSNKDKGLSMGVADYLVKPVSERQLLRALARIDGGDEEGHVLVVDDNADDRKLLRRILENADYKVTEVDGGEAAISHIRVDPPMLVVLDLMMPEVDGFAVLESLKANNATRQIPVVVVTAKELGGEERDRLQRRVESLLQKGLFDQQQLLSDVTGALERLST